jgi:monovalent cation:proton antiporter-2 (CPA2) family protein
MYAEGFFFQAFVYLAAAVIAVSVAKRLGLGSVLGYLAAGMVIGPFGFRLIGEEGEDILHFAEFGVVMMLFVVGLELQPSRLWKLRVELVGMGGLQLVLTAVAVAGVGWGLGLQPTEAIAVGLILALSSTAIVLQSLSERGQLSTGAGQSSFAVLLFQDIAVIPIIAGLPLLASGDVHVAGEHSTWVDGLPGSVRFAVVLASIGAVVLGGRFVIQPALRMVARTRLRELFVASVLLLVIGIALLMAQVGLSPALGTFIAGVVLAESEYRHELESDIEPFKGLLLGLFFIAVGASVDFGLMAESPGLVFGGVVALVAIKFLVLLGVARFFGLSTDQGLMFSFALAQGGEFGFVLSSYALQAHVLEKSTTEPLVAVVALSMALTPLLLVLFERFVRPRVGTRESERSFDEPEQAQVIVAGFGRFGQICARLLVAEGISTTVLENDSDQVDLLRKFGRKVFYGDASRRDLLDLAGADRARLLILAIDDPDKTLEIVHTVRKHFPRLKVLARAESRTDAYALIDEGVEHVFRETFDSALRMGVEALQQLGFRAHRAHRSAQRFRRQDEALMREMAQRRWDDDFVAQIRRRNEELEDVLRRELSAGPTPYAPGWDTASLVQSITGKPAPESTDEARP